MLVQRDAGLLGEPAVTPADAELVPALGQDVHDGDHRREHGRVPVRERVQHGAEADLLRPLAAAAKSDMGLAEMENFGKKKCSITAYTS